MEKVLQPLSKQLLFTANGFTAEMCIDPESLAIAHNLRYRAYLHAGAIPVNPKETFTDEYDPQRNVRTYLVWYEDRPVASVRSLTWSAKYDWLPTDCTVLFEQDINEHLGPKTPILESNRFVVDPEFKGRKSLMAQMLLFRVQAIGAVVDQCEYVITAVRPRHASFYKRLMKFDPISEPLAVDKVTFPIQLLATPVASREKLAESSPMAAYAEADVERYATLIQQLSTQQ